MNLTRSAMVFGLLALGVALFACRGSAAECCRIDPSPGGPYLGGSGMCGAQNDFWCSTNWRVEVDHNGCNAWRYDMRQPTADEDSSCNPKRSPTPKPTTCPSAPVSVRCGSTTCSGETPVCCGRDRCAKTPEACNPVVDGGSDAESSGQDYSECDDSTDCSLGLRCCATFDREMSRLSDQCTTPALCRGTLLCNQDCDCPDGSKCDRSTSPGTCK